MLLNLESRLAQRVLIEVAEGAYRDEDDLYALARSVDWGDWITPRQTLRVDTTAQHSPLRASTSPPCGSRTRSATSCARRTGERPSVDTAPPRPAARAARRRRARRALRRQLGRVAVQARLARRHGRCAAQGDAGRGDARRRRLARRAGRGRRPARPVLRLGHDRDRGGADRLRHRRRARCAASPSSGCCRSAAPSMRAEMQRLKQPGAGRASARRRCRSSPATCRSGWSTSRGATPSAPASPHAIAVPRRRRARAAGAGAARRAARAR